MRQRLDGRIVGAPDREDQRYGDDSETAEIATSVQNGFVGAERLRVKDAEVLGSLVVLPMA